MCADIPTSEKSTEPLRESTSEPSIEDGASELALERERE
jgi:hypothetical protein